MFGVERYHVMGQRICYFPKSGNDIRCIYIESSLQKIKKTPFLGPPPLQRALPLPPLHSLSPNWPTHSLLGWDTVLIHGHSCSLELNSTVYNFPGPCRQETLEETASWRWPDKWLGVKGWWVVKNSADSVIADDTGGYNVGGGASGLI